MIIEENSGIPCGCGRSPTGFCTGLHKLTNEQYQLARRLNEQKELLKEEGSSEENKM
jgi:CDGSH-type Zn-finger protein